LISVNTDLDLSYFKRMLEDTKRRLDEVSFIEQRAALVGSMTSLEGNKYILLIKIAS